MQHNATSNHLAQSSVAETPVSLAMNRQEASLERLHSSLSALSAKLSTVLAPNGEVGTKVDERPSSNIALVRDIDINTDRVEEATAIVQALLDSLGV